MLDDIMRINKLKRPTDGPLDVVLDTDAYNEVDDPFALAYLLLSPEKINLKAVFAAPFLNEKVSSPNEGMEKSYEEINRVLKLCSKEETVPVYRGADAFLPDENTAILSPAAERLIEMAVEQPVERPLYVVAIGAITNVASALLHNPSIAEKIVVVWLGGHAHSWPDTCEFNMFSDYAAARVVFGCGVPLVQIPCWGVASHLIVGKAELIEYLRGKNELCDYLVDKAIYEEEILCKRTFWSRIIWDVSVAAWLICPENLKDTLVHSPIPSYDGHYAHSNTRHLIRYVYQLDRDSIFHDLFDRLSNQEN